MGATLTIIASDFFLFFPLRIQFFSSSYFRAKMENE